LPTGGTRTAGRFIGEGRLESPVHPNGEAVAVLETLDEARHLLGYADRPEWSVPAAS
jgi:hypothetical protein